MHTMRSHIYDSSGEGRGCCTAGLQIVGLVRWVGGLPAFSKTGGSVGVTIGRTHGPAPGHALWPSPVPQSWIGVHLPDTNRQVLHAPCTLLHSAKTLWRWPGSGVDCIRPAPQLGPLPRATAWVRRPVPALLEVCHFRQCRGMQCQRQLPCPSGVQAQLLERFAKLGSGMGQRRGRIA